MLTVVISMTFAVSVLQTTLKAQAVFVVQARSITAQTVITQELAQDVQVGTS